MKVFNKKGDKMSQPKEKEGIVIGDKINFYKKSGLYHTVIQLLPNKGFSNLREDEQFQILLEFEELLKKLGDNTTFLVDTEKPNKEIILETYKDSDNELVLKEKKMFEDILDKITKEEYFVFISDKTEHEVYSHVLQFGYFNFFDIYVPNDQEFEILSDRYFKKDKIKEEEKEYYINEQGEYVSFLNLVSLVEDQKPFYFRGVINSIKDFTSDVKVKVQVKKMRREEAIRKLEKSKRELTGRHKFDKSEKGKMNQAIVYYQIESLLEEVMSNQDTTLLNYDLKIKFTSNSLEKLEEEKKLLKNAVKGEMKLASYNYEQEDEVRAWNMLSTNLKSKNEISISNFAYCFFFDYFEMIKPEGYIKNITQNEIISIDYFKKDSRNLSGNGYIFGTMGSGKSTEIKRMIKDYVEKDIQIYSIDQDKEYNKLCEYENGVIVQFGRVYTGDELKKLTTLNQIKEFKKDIEKKERQNVAHEIFEEVEKLDEEGRVLDVDLKSYLNDILYILEKENVYKEEEIKEVLKKVKESKNTYINPLNKGKSEMSNHIKFVSLFLRNLYLDKYTSELELQLEEVLNTLYQSFKDKEFTFNEVLNYLKHSFIVKNKEETEEEFKVRKQKDIKAKNLKYGNLIILLENLQNMYPVFCQKTNLEVTERFVNFDISETKNQEELNTSILFLIFKTISDKIYENAGKNPEDMLKTVLFMDEAHRMLKDPRTLSYILTMIREYRKYEALLWLASQSLRDIYDNTSETNLKTLFELINYKIILRQSPNVKDLMEEKLELTPTQVDRVISAGKGEGIISMGEGNFSFTSIILPEYLEIFSGGA